MKRSISEMRTVSVLRRSRKRTRSRQAAFLLLAVAVVGPSGLFAEAGEGRIVYPTGLYPTDHRNVQAAVDLGGTVLLKATDAQGVPTVFNFGPAMTGVGGRVNLTTDVAVIGEETESYMTTIRGGSIPFFGTVAVTTRIEGIHFEAPYLSAIIITRSTGSEIVGNRVSNVVGAVLPFVVVPPLTEGRGIKFLGNSDPDGALTGTIRVVGNVIEDMHADLSDAIVFDAVAADVEISQNRIETVQSSGILVLQSSGSVEITDNFVAPGAGDPGEFSFGNGITVGGGSGATYGIARNEIVCENLGADGIVLFGDGTFGRVEHAVVTGNDISMHGSAFSGIALEDDVSQSLITENTFAGVANYAIDLRQVLDGSTMELNELRDNDVGAFEAVGGHVMLDRHTRSTVVVGSGGTVTDLGEDNLIEGLAAFPLGPAQEGFEATVIVPGPGLGARIEPITAAAVEFDINGPEEGLDNARIEALATPTVAADIDLYFQREQPDGTWLTVGIGGSADLDKERLIARRQPGGRYRILVHNWAGGPQAAELVVTFFNQDYEPGGIGAAKQVVEASPSETPRGFTLSLKGSRQSSGLWRAPTAYPNAPGVLMTGNLSL